MSKSNFNFDFDELENEVFDQVKEDLTSDSFEVECPYCSKCFEAISGSNRCPYCDNEVSLNLKFDF